MSVFNVRVSFKKHYRIQIFQKLSYGSVSGQLCCDLNMGSVDARSSVAVEHLASQVK